MDHINGFKAAVAAVVAALTTLWGWFGWLIIVWLFCMALDYITGSIAAMKAGEWSSEKARNGLAHKGGCIAVVLIAAVLDLGIGVIVANIPGILNMSMARSEVGGMLNSSDISFICFRYEEMTSL